jgi:anti-sigma B factor antagonist
MVGDDPMDFEQSSDASGGVALAVHGEVDLESAPKLAEALDRVIDGGARLVVVKLENVTFIDSTGLRVLIVTADRLEGLEGQLFVEGASAAVAKVLEMTGLIERLRPPDGDRPAG